MFSKKSLSALCVCAAIVSAAGANAATDATLMVKGTFVPAACTPELSNGGIVDYGTMNNAALAKTTDGNELVQLGKKSITLTVSCDAATSVGIIAQDNRASSRVELSSSAYIADYVAGQNLSTSNAVFGLGTVNDVKIGAYSVTAMKEGLTADNAAVDMIVKDTDLSGTSWKSANAGGLYYPDGTRIITVAESGKTTPLMFKDLVMPLDIVAAVQSNAVLGSGAEITLDGNATLSLVYL
ncbi:TPA: DUF1120 domain-containing protein [Klebsiella quasipneumoniae]|nr:DUF1120 domain-containing protein [Klebsiella quasipneumoniae]